MGLLRPTPLVLALNGGPVLLEELRLGPVSGVFRGRLFVGLRPRVVARHLPLLVPKLHLVRGLDGAHARVPRLVRLEDGGESLPIAIAQVLGVLPLLVPLGLVVHVLPVVDQLLQAHRQPHNEEQKLPLLLHAQTLEELAPRGEEVALRQPFGLHLL